MARVFADRKGSTNAVGEEVLVDGRSRHREVLHDAREIAEADVDELHALVPDVAQDLVCSGEHPSSGLAVVAGDAMAPRLPARVPIVSTALRERWIRCPGDRRGRIGSTGVTHRTAR